MSTSQIDSPLEHLSAEQVEQLAKEFDAIHDEVFSELGDRDRRYIVSMIEMHRRLVSALGDSDPERAELVMKEHILRGRDFWLKSSREPAAPERTH